jgi:hypothetical protein
MYMRGFDSVTTLQRSIEKSQRISDYLAKL